MPDHNDAALARLATALVGHVPPPPLFDDLTHGIAGRRRGPSRPGRAAVVAALVVVITVIVIAVLVSTGSSDKEEPAAPTGFVPCTIRDPGFFVGPNGHTFGPAINQHPDVGGPVDTPALPDYIPVTCRNGSKIGGWIKKADMVTSPTPSSPDKIAQAPTDIDPVYADDGTTLVGHMYAAKGFVPLGEDPATVPTTSVGSSGVAAGTP